MPSASRRGAVRKAARKAAPRSSAGRSEAEAARALETRRLVHDLREHQTELEMQNHELSRAQLALAEARDRYRELYDSAPVAYLTLDSSSTVLEANRAAAALLGVDRGELTGRKLSSLMSKADADSFHLHRQRLIQTARKQACEVRLRRKDGASLQVRLESQVATRRSSGHAEWLTMVLEIAERKRLEQFRRMEAVGTLASGVAHDFNNLLTGIIGSAELSLRALDHAPATRRTLEDILRAATGGAAVVKQLLAFGKTDRVAFVAVHFDAVLEGMQHMLRRLIPEDVELRMSLGAGPVRVGCEAGQLEQILMNLVLNARRALPTGGKIEVQSARVQLTEQDASLLGDVVAGPYARLRVIDDGCGMDEETLSHAFEPFFTTSAVGEGSGLGLSTVFAITRQAGGHVELRSELDKGTSVSVYLPEHQKPPLEVKPGAAVVEPVGTETILLVEDEPLVRAVACQHLEAAGYSVLCAGSGPEALAHCRKHAKSIDLVLTDVVLPGGLSGQELARKVKAKSPKAAVLFMSAYPRDVLLREGRLDARTTSIEKPFTRATLLTQVRLGLHARAAETR